MTFNEILGKYIQELRKRNNISIYKFSLLTGFSKNKIRNIENGNYELYMSEIVKIAEALNISVINLFKQAGL